VAGRSPRSRPTGESFRSPPTRTASDCLRAGPASWAWMRWASTDGTAVPRRAERQRNAGQGRSGLERGAGDDWGTKAPVSVGFSSSPAPLEPRTQCAREMVKQPLSPRGGARGLLHYQFNPGRSGPAPVADTCLCVCPATHLRRCHLPRMGQAADHRTPPAANAPGHEH
jgi:hypothetical protein